MSKFDHRLKRLEARTGGKKEFELWIIPNERQIQNIKLDPEKKNIFIISAVPRPDRKALKERKGPPSEDVHIDVADLSDEELNQEIIRIQKELDNGKAKKKNR